MPTDDDAAERRALQRKAYGREGALTDAEAERLRELEGPSTSSETQEGSGREVVAPGPSAGSGTRVGSGGEVGEAEPSVGSGTQVGSEARDGVAEPVEAFRSALRRRWKAVVAASALLLAIGIGAGWALFGQPDRGMPLTAEQEERRLELYADGFFDEGSIRGVASDDDAFVWYATADDAQRVCVILEVGGQSQHNCVPPEDMATFGLQASVIAQAKPDDPNSISNSSVNAYLLLSTAGEPMASIQRWDMDSTWVNGFEGEERERVEELTEEGFDIGITLVGQFRGGPVWVADRFTDENSVEKCFIADGVNVTACGPSDSVLENGLFAQSVDVDEETGASTVQWALQVSFTKWQNPYLTITEHATKTAVGAADDESPPGDPIPIESPDGDAG